MKLEFLPFLTLVESRLATLANPKNHFYDLTVDGINPEKYKFLIFTDPQYGKWDKDHGTGLGNKWELDIDHTEKLCREAAEIDDLAFIVVAGDMAHALPNDEPHRDRPGDNPPFRPAQSGDFLDVMRTCPSGKKIFTIAGNRDIGNDIAREFAWDGYQAQFMEPFYYFQLGERYYIALDSQCYKLDFGFGPTMKEKQNNWLEVLFRNIPRDAPKSVFIHTALYIEYPEEVKAATKLKSLPLEDRNFLMDLFEYNNVDTVFSGHVHFENFLPEHRGIRQIVMTSINALNTWHSKETDMNYGPEWGNNERGYYVVEIDGAKKPLVQKVPILD